MRRLALAITGAVLVAVLVFPPWRVVWAPETADEGPPVREMTRAGFHFWAFARERPTQVIAWDGPGTGGHITVTGKPEVAGVLWIGLLVCSTVGVWLAARGTRNSSAVHREA
jgi:hypothetical protein